MWKSFFPLTFINTIYNFISANTINKENIEKDKVMVDACIQYHTRASTPRITRRGEKRRSTQSSTFELSKKLSTPQKIILIG